MVIENTIEEREFLVIRPLHDIGQKVATGHLGPIRITPAVRLRVYLMVMMLLVLYRVLDLARVVG